MKKSRRFFTFLLIHCLFSSVMFSAAYVYQKSYNHVNREQIRMASVTVQKQQAEIQILHCHLPVSVPEENNLFWYGAYLLTDSACHNWMAILEFIKNS